MSRGGFIAIFIGLLAALGLFSAITRDRSGDVAQTGGGAATPVPLDPSASEGSSNEPNVADVGTNTTPVNSDIVDVPPNLGKAGTLENLDGWLQTDATSFEAFDGRVKIVQFWTFSCSNCKRTIPYLQEIYADPATQGLEIIGVHAPEFAFEKDQTSIAQAAIDLGVTWPIALDTEKTNFRSWQTDRRFWPRTYVIDQNGDIRFDRIGEGRYDDLHDTVVWLIENGP